MRCVFTSVHIPALYRHTRDKITYFCSSFDDGIITRKIRRILLHRSTCYSIENYVTRGESSRFFPRVGLVPERQEFSRGCVYCPSEARVDWCIKEERGCPFSETCYNLRRKWASLICDVILY